VDVRDPSVPEVIGTMHMPVEQRAMVPVHGALVYGGLAWDWDEGIAVISPQCPRP
jgi:hypothetical protein